MPQKSSIVYSSKKKSKSKCTVVFAGEPRTVYTKKKILDGDGGDPRPSSARKLQLSHFLWQHLLLLQGDRVGVNPPKPSDVTSTLTTSRGKAS